MTVILDPTYLVMVFLPGLVLGGLASMYVKSTFARYSRLRSSRGFTGAEAAHEMLSRNGVYDVRIERCHGMLSDHYDPSSRTLRLSSPVYGSQSLAAIGVACHEAGHALQHAQGYAPLQMRTTLVPVMAFGQKIWVVFMLAGFILHIPQLFLVGVIVFGVAAAFSIVTLPVEWNASARAKKAMVTAGVVSSQESESAGAVLNAAFLTYVAAAVTAILTFLYFLLRSGLLGGRDD